jgi:hypothetical protein
MTGVDIRRLRVELGLGYGLAGPAPFLADMRVEDPYREFVVEDDPEHERVLRYLEGE